MASHLTIMGQGKVVFVQVSNIQFAEAAKKLADIDICHVSELEESEIWEHIVTEKGYKLSEYDWMVTEGEPEVVHE